MMREANHEEKTGDRMVRAKQKQRQLGSANAAGASCQCRLQQMCTADAWLHAVTVLSTQLAVGHTQNMDRAAHIYARRIAARR